LATITNAAGFVSGASSVGIGLIAGVLSYAACSWLKPLLGYDDALDTFGVHGVGGTIGALATAVLVDEAANPAGAALLGKGLLKGQLAAMGLCILLSLVCTWLLGKLVDRLVGLRATEEEQSQGLDIADHNEEGYSHS
jgi:Amt family ammonium transporter